MKKQWAAAVCASSLLLCCVMSGCGGGSPVYDTQHKCVFTVNGQKVYNSGRALYIMKDDNTFEYAEKESSGEESSQQYQGSLPNYFAVYPNCALSGNEYYSYYADSGVLYRYDLSDLKNVKSEKLYHFDYDPDAGMGRFDFIKAAYPDHGARAADTLTDEDLFNIANTVTRGRKMMDGGDGYIYCSFALNLEYVNKYAPIDHYLYRYAKDGSRIEFLTDFRASDFTMKDGVIYYFDFGYTYDADTDQSSIDASRAGIYKAKPDGSGRELMKKLTLTDEQIEDGGMKAGGRMEIIGDVLYYIDTDSGLYKMSLGGGEPTRVVDGMVSNYYIDTAENTVYYLKGEYRKDTPEGCPIVSVSLNGGSEKEIFKSCTNHNGLAGDLTTDGGYLYLSNMDANLPVNTNWKNESGEMSGEPNNVPCGRRVSLKTGEPEKLSCQAEGVYREDNFGTISIVSVGDVSIQWEKDGAFTIR